MKYGTYTDISVRNKNSNFFHMEFSFLGAIVEVHFLLNEARFARFGEYNFYKLGFNLTVAFLCDKIFYTVIANC